MWRIREYWKVPENSGQFIIYANGAMVNPGHTGRFGVTDCPQTDNKCTISNSLPTPKKQSTLIISKLKFWNDNV